jgi:hypothetical protein
LGDDIFYDPLNKASYGAERAKIKGEIFYPVLMHNECENPVRLEFERKGNSQAECVKHDVLNELWQFLSGVMLLGHLILVLIWNVRIDRFRRWAPYRLNNKNLLHWT